MKKYENEKVILIGEDDDDHYLLTEDALGAPDLLVKTYRVRNGVQMMDFLLHRDQFSDPGKSPRPSLILLDLNMPKMDGRTVLNAIKSDPNLRSIPVVVLTTTMLEDDVIEAYRLGANAFLRKPVRFPDFVKTMQLVRKFWLETTEIAHQ